VQNKVFAKLNIDAVPESQHVHQWKDLGNRQWLRADVINLLKTGSGEPLSVKPDSPPELPFAVQSPKADFLSLDDVDCFARIIANNRSWALHDILGIYPDRQGKREDFTRSSLDRYGNPINATLAQCLSLSRLPTKAIQSLLQSYFEHAGKVLVQPEVQRAIEDGSGVLTRRSIRELAYGYEESFLRTVLDPSDPRYIKHAFLVDDSAQRIAPESVPRCHSSADVDNDYFACVARFTDDGEKYYERALSTFSTGKGDPRTVGQLLRFQNQSKLDFFVGGELTIDGGAASYSDGLQHGFSVGTNFPPFHSVQPSSKLAVMLGSIAVPVEFHFDRLVNDLYNIKLLRFQLPASQFGPQKADASVLDMTVPGLLNVTEPRGFPLFISNPHFLDFEDLAHFKGIAIANRSLHQSYLDVEPLTGKTFRAAIRLQVNVPTNVAHFDVFHPNMYQVCPVSNL
jgi:hypothetical protein